MFVRSILLSFTICVCLCVCACKRVCVCACICRGAMVPMWRSEGNTQELIFSFHSVNSGNALSSPGLHGKCLCSLSHLTAETPHPQCFCLYFFIDTAVWIISSFLKVEILDYHIKTCQFIYVDALILDGFQLDSVFIAILFPLVGF